jgi:phosphoribosyl-ATP pyrophosphohydrolase
MVRRLLIIKKFLKRLIVIIFLQNLLYHLMVLLQNEGLSLADIAGKLRERHHQ